MTLFVAGVNPHRSAFSPLAALLAEEEARRAFASAISAHRNLSEGLLVAEDGRLELYAVAEEGCDAYDIAAELFGGLQGAPDVSASLYFAEGADAAAHLFAAMCELDEFACEGRGPDVSAAFGRAWGRARPTADADAVLGRLARAASALASSIAVESSGASTAALAGTAVELGRRVFGHLEKRSVLVVGANDFAQALAEAFAQAGVADFTVIATAGNELASPLSRARTASPEALEVVASNADVIIAGEAVEEALLSRRLMKGASRLRRGRPSLLVDASPNGSLVEPKVAAIDSVFLYTVDDLASLARETPWVAQGAAASREKLLAEASRSFELELVD